MFRSLFVAFLLAMGATAWAPPSLSPKSPVLAKGAATFGLISAIASSTLSPPAALAVPPSAVSLPSVTVAEKVTRQVRMSEKEPYAGYLRA